MSSDDEKYRTAIARIDAANAEDPRGMELDYSKRMTAWLERFSPEASVPLRLAARAQHIRRWEIPRSSYPMDRAGYLKWRRTLYDFHADTSSKILQEVGFDKAIIARVRSLLRKEKLKLDPEMQTLEDVICLVFLEDYFSEFAREHDQAKLLNIIKRTWAKMSPEGHRAAMTIKFRDDDLARIKRAIDPQ